MLIDWFTLIAQVVNFLVLVWLLRRFLYRPILAAIEKREQAIAARQAEAEAMHAEAQRARDEFLERSGQLTRERTALLNKTAEEVEAERLRLLAEARQEAERVREQWRQSLRSEQQHLQQTLGVRTRQELFAMTRQVLADLADDELEARMVALFLRRLDSLSEQDKENLRSELVGSHEPVLIRSAFALSAVLQDQIAEAVVTRLGVPQPVRFETASKLVSGIELVSDGHKVGWNVVDYLNGMEQHISTLLDDQGVRQMPAPARGASPDEP